MVLPEDPNVADPLANHPAPVNNNPPAVAPAAGNNNPVLAGNNNPVVAAPAVGGAPGAAPAPAPAPAAAGNVNAAAASSTLRFYLWDSEQANTSELFLIKILNSSLPKTLGDLRGNVKTNSQSKQYATYTFCSEKGASVPDTWTFPQYIASIKAAGDTEPAQENPGFHIANLFGGQDDSKVYDGANVYMKKPSTSSGFTAPKLADIDTTAAKIGSLPTAPTIVPDKTVYASSNVVAKAGKNSHDPAELGEREWSIIARNNGLLKGFVIDKVVTPEGTSLLTGALNARYQAFQFKSRSIRSSELTGDPTNDTMLDVRIPSFYVDDQSYVSVFETSSALQDSLATASFSELDIKASIKGGAFGYSASASFGYGSSNSDGFASSSQNNSDNMNISYNFPRVSLYLDQECLELTDQCSTDLQAVKDAASLDNFLSNYGLFYCTKVQLGGRLYASDDSSTIAGTSTTEKANTLKISASLSFSAPVVDIAASGSYASSTQTTTTSAQSTTTHNLTWQAIGGNTLLANNPPAWCSTVGNYKNWRITKQDRILKLIDLIGLLPGYTDIPAKLKGLTEEGNVAINNTLSFEVVSDFHVKYYLTMVDATIYNAGQSLNVLNAPTTDAIASDISQLKSFYSKSIGIANLSSISDDKHNQTFKLLNLDGSTVVQARYNTQYHMVGSTNSMQNVYFSNHLGNRMIYGSTTSAEYSVIYLMRPAKDSEAFGSLPEPGASAGQDVVCSGDVVTIALAGAASLLPDLITSFNNAPDSSLLWIRRQNVPTAPVAKWYARVGPPPPP